MDRQLLSPRASPRVPHTRAHTRGTGPRGAASTLRSTVAHNASVHLRPRTAAPSPPRSRRAAHSHDGLLHLDAHGGRHLEQVLHQRVGRLVVPACVHEQPVVQGLDADQGGAPRLLGPVCELGVVLELGERTGTPPVLVGQGRPASHSHADPTPFHVGADTVPPTDSSPRAPVTARAAVEPPLNLGTGTAPDRGQAWLWRPST